MAGHNELYLICVARLIFLSLFLTSMLIPINEDNMASNEKVVSYVGAGGTGFVYLLLTGFQYYLTDISRWTGSLHGAKNLPLSDGALFIFLIAALSMATREDKAGNSGKKLGWLVGTGGTSILLAASLFYQMHVFGGI